MSSFSLLECCKFKPGTIEVEDGDEESVILRPLLGTEPKSKDNCMENSTCGSKCARILFLTCQISTIETISGLFTFVFIGQF